MTLRARFIGTDGSMGYKHGQVYKIVISGSWIVSPFRCPYSSVEAFLNNWLPLKPGD